MKSHESRNPPHMIALQNTIKSTAGWCVSVGRKFMEVTPASTLIILIASLFAQVLLVLTFFLPIKILILLGSDTIPHYYPLYLKSIKKAHLVIGLSSLALICYALYIASEFTVYSFSRKGAKKLLAQSAKLTLFENQNQLATQSYEKFTRGLSAGIFSVIAFILLAYIYPFLFTISTLYTIIATLTVITIYNRKTMLGDILNTHYKVTINTLTSIGFLIAFICMIADFLYLDPPKILAALIALLLIRQGMSRAAIFLLDVIALRLQHRQINALFYHGKQLLPHIESDTSQLINLLNEDRRALWIQQTINHISPLKLSLTSTAWHQIGRSDIYTFEAAFTSANARPDTTYLFKIFGKNSSSLAEQERVLIEGMREIPAPYFLGQSVVENFKCHVFEFQNYRKLTTQEVGPAALSINQSLLSIEPPTALVERFSRSHLFLEQRLTREALGKIFFVTTQEQNNNLSLLSEQLPKLKEILTLLPRQIISFDTTPDTLALSDEGAICVTHWAGWKMEPIGASWPIGERPRLNKAFQQAKAKRISLHTIPYNAVLLCAITYAFENLCRRTKYVEATSLIPEILEGIRSNESFLLLNRENKP